jgi:hypothetical protein
MPRWASLYLSSQVIHTPIAPAEYFQVDSLSAKTVPFAPFSRRKFGVDDIVVIYLGLGVP